MKKIRSIDHYKRYNDTPILRIADPEVIDKEKNNGYKKHYFESPIMERGDNFR